MNPSLRYLTCLALLLGAAATGRGDDPNPAGEPAIVVRLKSLDGLLADVKYLAQLAGKGEEAKQIDGIIESLPVKDGLAGTGLDTKRPMMLYGVATADAINSHVVLLVPVSSEDALLNFVKETLSNFGLKVSKLDDGMHAVAVPNLPFEVYFTVADGYAYVTARDRDPIASGRRIPPAKLMPTAGTEVASATIRIDRIPDMIKQLALSQFEVQIAAAKEKKDNPQETPAQRRLRLLVIDTLARQIKNVVRDGKNLDVRLIVDPKSEDLAIETNLTGKPGSALAKDISALGERASQFAGSLAPAFHVGVNFEIPAELRDAVAAVFKEAAEQSMQHETDESRRSTVNRVVDAVLPILKAGRVDLGFGAQSDSAGHFTFAVGMNVPNSGQIESLLKNDLAATIPADRRSMFTPDAKSLAGVKVHQVTPPAAELSGKDRQLFGNTPTMLFAFPENRALAAIGADAESAISALLQAKPAVNAPPFRLTASLARMAPIILQDQPEDVRKAAQGTLASAKPGQDMISVTMEGGPGLKLRASMKALGETFFSKIAELER